ncbi:terpene synthase family protein [Streptomyces sp. NPDC059874]|uniref:terpene synthase family protein n=1 Tax=Streptomyces sp. NPDC059874 TaxID=3346983 RepID=UPI00364BF7A4
MSGSGFTLPNIYCPFPATTFNDRPNPATPDVARDVYALIDKLDGGTPLLRDAAAGVHLADFAGRLHPDVSPQGLALVFMSHLVFYGHEAWIEQGEAPGHYLSPLELNRTYDRALEVFDGASTASSDTLVADLLGHFGNTVRSFNRPENYARIRTALEGYLRSQVWERDFRNHREMPSLATYQAMRRNTSSTVLYLELFTLFFDLNIPVTLLDHPVVRQLQDMQANYTCWVNDIFSFEKELKEDGALNLIFLLREARNLSWQQAVDAAAEMVKKEATDYLDLKARLPRLGIPLAGALAELLDQEERWQAHCIVYQQRAPRFSVTS